VAPKTYHFQTISPPNILPANACVSLLLDENTGEWKVSLIRQIFLLNDAKTILSSPRSRYCARDRLIWAYTPRGTFTVNSAYKVASSLSSLSHPCRTSSDQTHKAFWQTIWSLKTRLVHVFKN